MPLARLLTVAAAAFIAPFPSASSVTSALTLPSVSSRVHPSISRPHVGCTRSSFRHPIEYGRCATTNDGDDRGESYTSLGVNRRSESNKRALLAARLGLERRAAERRDVPADDEPELKQKTPGLRVGIAGAGAVAFGTSAFLSCRGHDPMLWSPSGAGTAALVPPGAVPLTATGAVDAAVTPRIAETAGDLARDNDAILIALPANGHKAVFDAIAPHIRPGQPIIIGSHASLGAVYLRQLLHERGVEAPVTAWGTTAVLARRTSGSAAEVNVIAVRKLIDACTVPSEASEAGLAVCRRLFGTDRFRPRDGLLAISLSNLNPQNHMGIALGNMSRMERGEKWSQGQNVTPNIGRLLEELDRERLDIAAALGLEVRTIFEHFHLSFHVPVADSVSEMNAVMHERGRGATGPSTGDSRYVTEDVPYGLALTVELGKLTERPATLHESGVRIFSAMYGQDFAAENELLNALDLSSYNLEDLQRAAQTGLLRHACEREVC